MDTENLEAAEENVTPEVEETPEAIVEEPSQFVDEVVPGGDDDGSEEDVTPEEPAYEPNYSFRAGEEEYEMDDWLKSKIENAEDEQKFRDLAERAHGLDVLKPQREQLRRQVQDLEGIEQQRQGAVQQLQHHVNNNEWEPFQRAWKISDDAVLNRAVQIMQLREMPPEQQQAYQQHVHARDQNYTLQQQNQQLMQQQSDMAVAHRSNALDSTLAHEHFSGAAQQFDDSVGRPGAFRDEIIRRGQYYAHFEQRDVPPHVLAQEIASFMPRTQQPAQQSSQVVQQQAKPTLPNIRGGSNTPVRGGINTIADIIKRRDELTRANG